MSDTQLPSAPASEALHVARYDELKDASGALRPHWQGFATALTHMTEAEHARRTTSARAVIRDNGVTYNVYDEAGGRARPWQLDIIPLVIGATDWAVIEAAVAQRARLADALLRDIYGPQRLIADGHLPPHLVLGHPQFLRPLMDAKPPGGVHVHLWSADIARAPDGSWVVLSARADAPGGIGYALENRIVVSQLFPDLFRDMQVERHAAFFHAHREHVLGLAEGAPGRAVLLTPGAYNEAYFEHAYLAHYLGLSLVEGQDLVVRDGQVFLKTLAGLERVAVIFRRLDSDFCDPLEFRAESTLGVPGLAEAARTGGVVLANALGGGVIESPALGAYLPSAAQALLGETLLIPDIATVWCGTAWGRAEALKRLSQGVLRNAFDARPLFSRHSSARLGSELKPQEVAQLAGRLVDRGGSYVVQDIAPLGLAPVFENGAVAPKPVSLRVFAAWTPDGYMVLPGALTRVASDETIRALSMQSGAATKDTWVLSGAPVGTFSLLRRSGEPVAIRHAGDDAPSRAMDNLFWLGRYAERAEDLVRVLRAVVLRLGDDPALHASATVGELARRLLLPLGQASVNAVEDAARGSEARLSAELRAAIFDPEQPHGLQRLLGNVLRTAWAVRDRLSIDTWRTIHALTTAPETPGDVHGALDPAGARSYLDALVRRAAALAGLSAENMTRGSNWLFVDLGRRVERATHAGWLVRQTLAFQDDREIDALQLALEIADSSMTYRSRYFNVFQLPPALDLLLLDDTNPRSLAFQLETVAQHVAELPKSTPAQQRGLPAVIAGEAWKAVRGADPFALEQADASGRRPALMTLIATVDDAMTRLSDAIADAYFQHAVRRRADVARRDPS